VDICFPPVYLTLCCFSHGINDPKVKVDFMLRPGLEYVYPTYVIRAPPDEEMLACADGMEEVIDRATEEELADLWR
jgi:hypothetical protein